MLFVNSIIGAILQTDCAGFCGYDKLYLPSRLRSWKMQRAFSDTDKNTDSGSNYYCTYNQNPDAFTDRTATAGWGLCRTGIVSYQSGLHFKQSGFRNLEIYKSG